jgi:[ribosomal protein S5]-alanine N-acetyltransferase
MNAPPLPDPPLTDGSVLLRASEPRDAPAIDAGIHDPDVIRWIGPTKGSAIDVVALNRERWASGSPTLSICEADGTCVGLVWVNVHEADETTGSVGYWLLPMARGRGLATRAVRLISGWAVSEMGLTNLRLTTEPENERSRRVAERSGFRQTALLHHEASIDGRLIDQVVYELPITGLSPRV